MTLKEAIDQVFPAYEVLKKNGGYISCKEVKIPLEVIFSKDWSVTIPIIDPKFNKALKALHRSLVKKAEKSQ